MKRVIKTAVAVAAFGLTAGVCAPALAQTAETSDLINGFDGPGATSGVLQFGSLGFDLLNGQERPYMPYGFRHGRSVTAGDLSWTTPYGVERLICASGDDPVYGSALSGANTMAGPAAGIVTSGPGGPVIPTPQLVGTVQPSVEQAAVLAGPPAEAGVLVDAAQQAAPPADASAPQMTAPAMDASAPVMDASAPVMDASAPAMDASAPQMAAPDMQQGTPQVDAAPVVRIPQAAVLAPRTPQADPAPVVEADAAPVVEADPAPVVEAVEPMVEADPAPVVEAVEPMVEAAVAPVVEAVEPMVEAGAAPAVEAVEPVVEAAVAPVVEADAAPVMEPMVAADPAPVVEADVAADPAPVVEADVAPAVEAVEPVVDSAPIDELSPVSDAIVDGTTLEAPMTPAVAEAAAA